MSTLASTTADPELVPPGTVVGAYVVDAPIGVGGFARVYRAHHPHLRTSVAIKVITRALALDALASERFVREARAASRIEHPCVVRVIGFGLLADGRAYQVMELVEGGALDQHLAARDGVDVPEALRLLGAIAAGLQAAHAVGIVHRDLKPANILLGANAAPRLADFGIAKALAAEEDARMTQTGVTLGTPTYMSPEQALGRDVSPASDIYAFGVLAFELLVGRVPFLGGTPFEVMMMHVQDEPPLVSSLRPDRGQFDDAIRALLAKHPADRPPSIEVAMQRLTAAANTPLSARPWLPRVAVDLALVAAVALLLGLGAPPRRVAPAEVAAPTQPAPDIQATQVEPAPVAPVAPAVVIDAAPAPPPAKTRPRPVAARDPDSLEIPPAYQEPSP